MRNQSPLLLKSITTAALGLCALIGAPRLEAQPNTVTTLHRFIASDGTHPYYGLTLGLDGTLYGTCVGVEEDGGAGGSVFKMNPDGPVFTVLHTFNPTEADGANNVGGANPLDGPLLGTDGLLYGCTEEGGTGAYGVVYSLTTNGGNFTLLTQFGSSEANVEYQYAGMVQGSDGFLYGMGASDGINNWDSQVYKIDTNGNNYANLTYFTTTGGGYDYNPMLPGRNGNLYGVTGGDPQNDPANVGTVFMLTPGGTYTLLHTLAGNDGRLPDGGLIEDTSGTLYGTASEGGTYAEGTAFRIGTNGLNFTTIHQFGNGSDGANPAGRLLLASDGYLYGTTIEGGTNGFGTVYRMSTNGSNYQVFYSFTGDVSSNGDHGYPNGCLIEAGSGLIYGMNSDIDFNFDPPIGNGSIFELNAITPLATSIQAISTVFASPTNLTSVQWTVAFAAAVTGVDATNFQLAVSGLTGSPAITAVSGSGTNWTVTASTGSGAGTLQLNLTNAAGISPSVTNTLPYTGQAYVIDLVPPTIAISSPSASITASDAVSYTVTYADANFNASTLAAGNITLNTSGTVDASSIVVTGAGTTWTVTLSGITGDGTLGISIAAGTASDTAGNLAPAAGPSATFTVDNTPPTVTIGEPTPAATTNGPASSVSYSVTYADANFDSATLTAGNISLTNSALTANVSVVQDSATNFTVTLSDLAGVGAQAIQIAAGTATDLAGNVAAAAGPSDSFIVSNAIVPMGPSIDIASPTPFTTVTGSVTYTVTYLDSNFLSSSLVAADISVNTLGSATGTVGSVVGGIGNATGTNYTVTINGISGSGSLSISIAAGTALNSLGGQSAAAGPSYPVVVDLWQFDSLYSFTNGTDGNIPQGGLTLAGDGNLYGVTLEGGDGSSGTIFKVGTNGLLTVLYPFTGADDGGTPYAGLTLATDGLLYGTTSLGGTNGGGTIFDISTNGNFQVLNDFSSSGVDGWIPDAPMIQATDGFLYGTTSQGGENTAGNIFRISTNGVLTNFYSFSGPDGDAPMAPLFQASDGNFYGTASMGGDNSEGTIFQITPGQVFMTLYSFSAAPSLTNEDGTQPIGGLVQGRDGGLYGITSGGGPDNGGTVFRITTNGTFSVIHALNPNLDGDDSTASLILGSDGNLYGTTQSGSPAGSGSVFQVTTNGVLTVLYSFVGGSFGDGSGVTAPVLQAPGGNLYGAATGSGHGLPNGSGAIFELINPNPPPAITGQPTNLTVPFGGDASFVVSATSVSPVTYQWAFDGTNIDGATNAILDLTNVTFGEAGSYSAEVGNSNATIESATAILLVTQAEAIITLSDLNQTYDGMANIVTATTEPGGLTVNLTYDNSTNAPTNAGSYIVIGTIDDPSYFGSVTNTLVVSNALLVAGADNQSRYVNQPNPVFTGSLFGAVAGDDLSLSFTTMATPSSPPGDYAIVPVINDPNDQLSNYNVIVVNGTLTVSLGEPTITLTTNSILYTLEQSPVILAPGALVTAPNSPSFAGGQLTVQITSNAGPLDLLFVQDTGTGPGEIGVGPGSITFGGLDIASYTGGTTNDSTLEFTFNANANVAGIQELIDNLTFAIEYPDTTNLTRGIELTLDDGNSLTSAPVSLTIVINHRPVAMPYLTATGTNLPLTISFARLLTNCSDADGDPITITQVETNSLEGGVVTTNGTSLTYTPATNYAGEDQFTYFISDGRTGTNTGMVYVLVLTGNSLAIEDPLINPALAGQVVTLGIEGIADRTYRLQASEDLLSWSQIATVTMPDDGFTNYLDTEAINYTNRFYRTVYP
jgi:uncharacterized repeat protein (TIGR03803 family)